MRTERELLDTLVESDFWKYVRTYLLERREALFMDETLELQRQRGALQEVTRLLNLPNLILAKLTMEDQRQQESLGDLLDG